MRNLGKGLLAVLVFSMLIAGPNLVGVLPPPVDDVGDTRGPEPLSDGEPVWSDKLDDLSRVYTPEGLVDVEVTGGEARLVAGEDEGYIASEVIRAEPGYNYNIVYLDAVVPGNSSIEISILNAAKESSVVGYANATVPGFMKKVCTDRSLTKLGCVAYPAIRIQVNLNADGTDRPRLLGWTLTYVPFGEWRDKFLGTGKMEFHNGINVTGGVVEIDRSRIVMMVGTGNYEAYPPVFIPFGEDSTSLNAFYPDVGGTGYEDRTQVTCQGTRGVAFDDLDVDGDLDLICANYKLNSNWVDSQIFWGDGTGTWSSADATDLHTQGACKVVTGDFNGDGEIDLAFACTNDGNTAKAFLNQGGGDFNYQPDVDFGVEAGLMASGDLNSDGYHDIVFSNPTSGYTTYVYYGGPDGPDTTADHTYTGQSAPHVEDIDGDGFPDLLLGTKNRPGMNIYLGGPDGPGSNPDYQLTAQGRDGWYTDAGDINGDGFIDLVLLTHDPPHPDDFRLFIFGGSENGWSSNDRHLLRTDDSRTRFQVLDIDLDGYEDILMTGQNKFEVWYGGSSWPSSAGISKDIDDEYGDDIAAAVPKFGVRAYAGSLITEEITLPPGRKWDILDLEAALPRNTSVSISVLDGDKKVISGYRALPDTNIDLSGISGERYIHILIRIWSEFNSTTPVLDRMIVLWQDEMTWREQFYGLAKVDRCLGMDVVDGALGGSTVSGAAPQILLPSMRGDDGYNTRSMLYLDSGGLDYLSRDPMPFMTRGTSAVSVAKVDDDDLIDVAFAVHRTTVDKYDAKSPLFLNSPLGWKSVPDHTFPTTGATDVVIEDINGDGFVDVVFAQEQDGTTFHVNSTLFWGSAAGWSLTPDVTFATTGASDVEVVDVDGDTRLDLVFACFRDSSTTATDSMVFLQGATGFDGTTPDHLLATKGARGVASGDIDDDGHVDLVFANSRSGGLTEIDSYIYWGKAGGGFATGPKRLASMGAMDVAVADLDRDGHLDVVLANEMDNSLERAIDSYVYLGDGTRGFGSSPDATLPTTGAVAVEVMDLDGSGWKDLAFACQFDGTSYEVGSPVYLGGPSGWSITPDILLPTEGASDVMSVHMFNPGQGGYRSNAISLRNPRDFDVFHTFMYTASLGPGQSGTLQIVDSDTSEVLAETPLMDGTNSWYIGDQFLVREHSSIQVVVVVQGLDASGAFSLDDLWLNWTQRVERHPVVHGLDISEPSVLRLKSVELSVNVSDDYDLTEELVVLVQHRINGTDTWADFLIDSLSYDPDTGTWRTTIIPKVNAAVGMYDLRVDATDLDRQLSNWVEFPNVLEVLNNLPTTPVVHIEPAVPVTTAPLRVEIDVSAIDVETPGVTYIYRWYRDGVLFEDETSDILPFFHTTKGENWTVEVSAFDGTEEGLPGIAGVVIVNAPPQVTNILPDPELDEDTSDSDWLDLSTAFEDADGDALEWSVAAEPENIDIDIDPETGRVTITPHPNWYGEEEVTFVASDPDLEHASQTVTIMVNSVNDIPVIAMVDGKPPASDTLEYTMKQGETLTITYAVADVEGDEIQASVNTSAVTFDEVGQRIVFEPGNEAVGTLRFGLRINDVESPLVKVSINFVIVIENENDPMDDPRITSPLQGVSFKEGFQFSLIAICTDPDTIYGQILNFSWSSNMSGHLGYGPSLNIALTEVGTHVITLTVTDGDHQKMTTVTVVITAKEDGPPPPPPDDNGGTDEPFNYALVMGIVVALVVIGVLIFVARARKTTEELETADEEEYMREHMERAAVAVKAAADALEAEESAVTEAPLSELEDIDVESTAMPQMSLSMEAKKTEAASAQTMALFGTAETAMSEEEMEAMRLDNLKRKYQNAIGRLPYGIPSKELQDMDWVDLSSALATGEKRTTPDGRETTEIDGRWYYSDEKDTGSFLKEHGARKKPGPEKKDVEATTDNTALLAKLEERFIMGEISEENYRNLVEKYEE